MQTQLVLIHILWLKSAKISKHNIFGISDTNKYFYLYYIAINYNIISKY